MDKPVVQCEMIEPRFIKEGYNYIGEDEQWHIKDDAPDLAKKEFEEYMAMVNSVSDEDGMIIQV